ncbi:MAG: DUF1062 domain-containing protein [Lachnospiraceae bacterium]|nr:DUF1062 domain-containing protein [Lachnospiraceae bacterium]
MSYLKKIEYEIVSEKSFSIIRNCSGCGAKARYINTKRFRVNANGNRLDVWLIYQCEKCKHTFNLTVYERQKTQSVPKEEYLRFLNNDEELAEEYGRNFQFFKKNKAEVDSENIEYQFRKVQEMISESTPERVEIVINNSYGLKIRPEKQIAEVLGISRSKVKYLMEQEKIRTETISSQIISILVDIDCM